MNSIPGSGHFVGQGLVSLGQDIQQSAGIAAGIGRHLDEQDDRLRGIDLTNSMHRLSAQFAEDSEALRRRGDLGYDAMRAEGQRLRDSYMGRVSALTDSAKFNNPVAYAQFVDGLKAQGDVNATKEKGALLGALSTRAINDGLDGISSAESPEVTPNVPFTETLLVHARNAYNAAPLQQQGAVGEAAAQRVVTRINDQHQNVATYFAQNGASPDDLAGWRKWNDDVVAHIEKNGGPVTAAHASRIREEFERLYGSLQRHSESLAKNKMDAAVSGVVKAMSAFGNGDIPSLDNSINESGDLRDVAIALTSPQFVPDLLSPVGSEAYARGANSMAALLKSRVPAEYHGKVSAAVFSFANEFRAKVSAVKDTDTLLRYALTAGLVVQPGSSRATVANDFSARYNIAIPLSQVADSEALTAIVQNPRAPAAVGSITEAEVEALDPSLHYTVAQTWLAGAGVSIPDNPAASARVSPSGLAAVTSVLRDSQDDYPAIAQFIRQCGEPGLKMMATAIASQSEDMTKTAGDSADERQKFQNAAKALVSRTLGPLALRQASSMRNSVRANSPATENYSEYHYRFSAPALAALGATVPLALEGGKTTVYTGLVENDLSGRMEVVANPSAFGQGAVTYGLVIHSVEGGRNIVFSGGAPLSLTRAQLGLFQLASSAPAYRSGIMGAVRVAWDAPFGPDVSLSRVISVHRDGETRTDYDLSKDLKDLSDSNKRHYVQRLCEVAGVPADSNKPADRARVLEVLRTYQRYQGYDPDYPATQEANKALLDAQAHALKWAHVMDSVMDSLTGTRGHRLGGVFTPVYGPM